MWLYTWDFIHDYMEKNDFPKNLVHQCTYHTLLELKNFKKIDLFSTVSQTQISSYSYTYPLNILNADIGSLLD